MSQLDVQQMEAAGDPAVLGAGTQSLVSLAGYSGDNGTTQGTSGGGRRLLATPSMAQVLGGKVAELVGAFSQAVAGLLGDPAGIKQVSRGWSIMALRQGWLPV
jgi:hypothetical protein